ncbi:MAG: hypothetical protein AVDCRST_MAG01-01-1044, partial [uncultured Rubrobacteraceae bacterium]
ALAVAGGQAEVQRAGAADVGGGSAGRYEARGGGGRGGSGGGVPAGGREEAGLQGVLVVRAGPERIGPGAAERDAAGRRPV